MQVKIKIDLACIAYILIAVIIPASTLAITGNDSSGGDIRYELGYITFNSTDGTTRIQSFGDYLSSLIEEIALSGWFSSLEYNIFRPDTPTLNLPINDSYRNSTLQFDWSNTTDTENFEVSYLFEIWNNSATTNIHFANYSIKETENTTKTNPTIKGEGVFYWRVAANDSSKNSTFSNLRVITIDTTLPSAFNITSPADQTSTEDTTPILEWGTATDTNLDNYTIEISTTANFAAINQTEVTETTSLSNWSSPLGSARTYYWRIRAVDKANNQRLSENNRSLTITGTQTTTRAGSTIESSSGGGTKPYTLNIIAPEGVTIYKDDTITIPLLVINPSSVSFSGINLKLSSTISEVTLALDKYYIPSISAKSQEKLQLTITTGNIETGTYGLIIDASIANPGFSDTFRIFANLIERDSAAKEEVSERIEFAKQLFSGNPECLDLSEYLSEAESALQSNQRDKALSLAENAVEACNKLIAQLDSFSSLTTQAAFLDKIKSQFKIESQLGSKTLLIITPQIIVLVLIISIALYFRRRKKLKKAGHK